MKIFYRILVRVAVYLVVFSIFFFIFDKYFYEPNKSVNYGAYEAIKTTQEYVKTKVFNKGEMSRLYAVSASVYSESLDAGASKECAKYLSDNITFNLYDEKYVLTENKKNCDLKIYNKWLDWHRSDKEFFNKSYTKPNIKDVPSATWESKEEPLMPNAGNWKRFAEPSSPDFDKYYKLPPPPSVEQAKIDAKEVQMQMQKASAQDKIDAEYYNARQGTQEYVGLWTDFLNKEVKTLNRKVSEKEYAKMQMALTQSMADSFLETWKYKFKYWTARPSMVLPELEKDLLLPNPNFPSYPSGHSTVGATAATVMKYFIPERASVWEYYAERLRTGRVDSGVHFVVDTVEGGILGTKIAGEYLKIANAKGLERLALFEQKKDGKISLYEYGFEDAKGDSKKIYLTLDESEAKNIKYRNGLKKLHINDFWSPDRCLGILSQSGPEYLVFSDSFIDDPVKKNYINFIYIYNIYKNKLESFRTDIPAEKLFFVDNNFYFLAKDKAIYKIDINNIKIILEKDLSLEYLENAKNTQENKKFLLDLKPESGSAIKVFYQNKNILELFKEEGFKYFIIGII